VKPVVAVLGTVNRDVILDADGERHESLGGILYNAIALGVLLDGRGYSVRPIGRLGAEDRRLAIDILSAYPAIEADALIEDRAGTNLSVLEYAPDRSGERTEHVEMRVASLSDGDLKRAAGSRACLVNMISGRDVERAVLARLRASERGMFVLDVQALARTASVPRRPRLVPDFAEWSPLFEIVRGNEVEIAHFGALPANLDAAVAAILRAGAGEVVATRAERGGRSFRDDAGIVSAVEYAAVPCARPVDPTGCGDTFLSAVCAGRVLGLSREDSLRLGAFVASKVAGLAGLEELVALRGIVSEAIAHEPSWAEYF
jgi:sugar/nucleoside kinase (ribokinase family)